MKVHANNVPASPTRASVNGTGEDDTLLEVEPEAVPPREPLSPELVRKLMWRILPPVWLGYVMNIIDRQNLGYAQLQMAHDLHLSHSAFGLASGIFFAAYSLMQVSW